MALFMGSGRVMPIAMTNIVSNQTKSNITPSTVSQIIRPDEGYTGLGQVTVNAIPDTYYLPSGTYTVTNFGTYDIKSKASVSTPAMANPTWTTATLNSSAAKVVYSITLSSGFKSASQTFSSSYTLPTAAGTTIVPSDTSQIAVESYKWTTGSIIVDAIPEIYTFYKKLFLHSVNTVDVNNFLSTQTTISSYFFMGQSQSSFNGTVIGSLVTNIEPYAFCGCRSITGISFPILSILTSSAFMSCGSLETINLPNVVSLSGEVFMYCYNLTNLNLPNLEQISGNYTFYYCSKYLSTISFPKLKTISGAYAFGCCSSIQTVNLPLLEAIYGYNCFYTITNSFFTSLNLPICSFISASAFVSCYYLSTISLPKIVNISGSDNFRNCYRLTSLYLMNSIVATLSNSNAFSNTPIGGYSTSAGTFGSIYVPSSLLTQYQTATNWSYFSSRFVGI